jgi:undecaprenyl diphosphate synthase
MHKEGAQLRHIGHLDQLPPTLRKKVLQAIETTKNNERLVLNLAFNYGGRDEIVCAIRDIIAEGLKPEEVTPEVVSKHMFTNGIPDPDLIIRTSGEMRISNFLTWQAAYSEWYVTSTLWPDFDREELYKALVDYSRRERRYGLVGKDCSDYQ